ncbi:hypothetical protein HIM_06733 [Hirsutella minnesotensis 3608]|uniref:Uncharacterized protein n=1 Tax=Hirsutella minnesotensis 3608 TaxID=1043627 RepID=A0A0F7ZNJ1_9HYPO|nr:hypothetical protein HIM_06733 [Hirsutella minnesotensis 3608]
MNSGLQPESQTAKKSLHEPRGILGQFLAEVKGPAALPGAALAKASGASSARKSPFSAPSETIGAAQGRGSQVVGDLLGGVLKNTLGSSAGGPLLGQLTSLTGGFTAPVIKSLADGLQTGLGVPQYYSLHPRSFCYGNFADPNEPQSAMTTRSCTTPGKRANNLREVLGFHGPLSNVTDGVNLPRVLNESSELLLSFFYTLDVTFTALFVLAAIFSFLSVVFSFGSFMLATNKFFTLVNVIISATASTLVITSFVVVSLAIAFASNSISQVFRDFQISSKLGIIFMGIGIAASVLSLGAAGIWFTIFLFQFRATVLQFLKTAFTRDRPAKVRILD